MGHKSVALRETDQALIARCDGHIDRLSLAIHNLAYNRATDTDIELLREINLDFAALVRMARVWVKNGHKGG